MKVTNVCAKQLLKNMKLQKLIFSESSTSVTKVNTMH